MLAALIQSEPDLRVLGRELKKMFKNNKVTVEEFEALLPDVLKRDVPAGEHATKGKRQVSRAAQRALRKAAKKSGGSIDSSNDQSASQFTC